MATKPPVSPLGTPTRVSETGTPPKAGRSTVDYSAFVSTIEALRKEPLGTSWCYDDVKKPAAVAQGLRKFFGIKASSRNVEDVLVDPDKPHGKTKKVGELWIENRDLETDDEPDVSYSDNPEN